MGEVSQGEESMVRSHSSPCLLMHWVVGPGRDTEGCVFVCVCEGEGRGGEGAAGVNQSDRFRGVYLWHRLSLGTAGPLSLAIPLPPTRSHSRSLRVSVLCLCVFISDHTCLELRRFLSQHDLDDDDALTWCKKKK